MEKLTKKEFKELYQNNNLMLIKGNFNYSKEKIIDVLVDNEHAIQKYLIKASNYSIDNYKDILIYSIYKHNNFIIVECVNNCSKDNFCSWNDIILSCVVYYKTN